MAHAKAHRHPEQVDRTIWEMFEAERQHLVPYAGRFDGFHSVPASVSKTCTVRFDNNKYSVLATAVGRPVEVHGYADRIVIRQNGIIMGEHARVFGRGQTVYDPWHYVPVLAREPGALRNGAPFKDRVLPPAMAAIRRRLKSTDDGDRQMVQILSCVPEDGLQAVESARPARRSSRAFIRLRSSSISWLATVTPHPQPCASPTNPWPTARGSRQPPEDQPTWSAPKSSI